jgi:uncharacterized protein YhhL (DUF1145 family)
MSLPKIGVAVIWIACLASFLAEPGSTAGQIGRVVFWVLVVVHAIECAAFSRLLKRAPGSLGRHLVETFVFGMFHVKEVQLAIERDAQVSG